MVDGDTLNLNNDNLYLLYRANQAMHIATRGLESEIGSKAKSVKSMNDIDCTNPIYDSIKKNVDSIEKDISYKGNSLLQGFDFVYACVDLEYKGMAQVVELINLDDFTSMSLDTVILLVLSEYKESILKKYIKSVEFNGEVIGTSFNMQLLNKAKGKDISGAKPIQMLLLNLRFDFNTYSFVPIEDILYGNMIDLIKRPMAGRVCTLDSVRGRENKRVIELASKMSRASYNSRLQVLMAYDTQRWMGESYYAVYVQDSSEKYVTILSESTLFPGIWTEDNALENNIWYDCNLCNINNVSKFIDGTDIRYKIRGKIPVNTLWPLEEALRFKCKADQGGQDKQKSLFISTMKQYDDKIAFLMYESKRQKVSDLLYPILLGGIYEINDKIQERVNKNKGNGYKPDTQSEEFKAEYNRMRANGVIEQLIPSAPKWGDGLEIPEVECLAFLSTYFYMNITTDSKVKSKITEYMQLWASKQKSAKPSKEEQVGVSYRELVLMNIKNALDAAVIKYGASAFSLSNRECEYSLRGIEAKITPLAEALILARTNTSNLFVQGNPYALELDRTKDIDAVKVLNAQ